MLIKNSKTVEQNYMPSGRINAKFTHIYTFESSI